MADIQVAGDGWSHPVIVGPIAETAPRIAELCGQTPIPLVSDEALLALHGARLDGIADFRPIALPRGEAAKDWDSLQRLVAFFAELNVTRDTPIVAFGGGSIGDVTGLAAALFKRGCPIVHVPTTLLAQVDSAIGGKTAIDDCGQKNLVGTFHPPALVACDPAFLETLDDRQYRAGYAEVVKYGLIDDPRFFDWCERDGALLIGRDRAAQAFAIDHCVRAKARFVEADLHDRKGRRALLNLGHSVAHALEAMAGIGKLLHGEAVAAGLSLAFGLSRHLGLCAEEDERRVRDHLRAVGLPVSLADTGVERDCDRLMSLLAADKKAGPDHLTLILAKGIGEAFIARNVDRTTVADFVGNAP